MSVIWILCIQHFFVSRLYIEGGVYLLYKIKFQVNVFWFKVGSCTAQWRTKWVRNVTQQQLSLKTSSGLAANLNPIMTSLNNNQMMTININ